MGKNGAAVSVLLFALATADAVTEVGDGTMYVSAVAFGSFAIPRANFATAGRTFFYVLQG